MVNALKNDEITAIVIDDAIARKVIDNVSGLKILESSFYSADYQVAVVGEDDEKNGIFALFGDLILGQCVNNAAFNDYSDECGNNDRACKRSACCGSTGHEKEEQWNEA